MSGRPSPSIGIIAGSGIYELTGIEEVEPLRVETPFGSPSDAVQLGRLAGRSVAFLARHGAGHRLLPGEINYRANVFALKQLGVTRILSASAVGSMRRRIRPRDVVLVDQFIDRTSRGSTTFFGGGIAAHVAFADPVCPEARRQLLRACGRHDARAHDGGTYLGIDGPAFSTRAESRLYRSWGADVIGMTNVQEAKLAREAEICYASLGLVTDYDCWHEQEAAVSVGGVLDNLAANADLAAAVLRDTVAALPGERRECSCGDALRDAIITSRAAIGEDARSRLWPILGKYLDGPP
jgi:5'-methylthioadenosine phosphorylase